MILTILCLISLTLSYIFYRKFRSQKLIAQSDPSKDPVTIANSSYGTVLISCLLMAFFWLVVIITVTIAKFTTSTEDYQVALQDREGLLYAATITSPDSSSTEDLFNQIHTFNKNIISRRTYQHNIFAGWFIPNWADDIELIDYVILAPSNPNSNQITTAPYLLAFHTGIHEH